MPGIRGKNNKAGQQITYSKRTCAPQSSQETKDDQLVLGLCGATHRIEDDVEKIGRLQNERPAKDLGQRRRDQRNEGCAQQENRQR